MEFQIKMSKKLSDAVESLNQKFGNFLIGFLMMFFVVAMVMLFLGFEATVKIGPQPEKEKKVEQDSTKADYFNAEDWIMFSPY